MKMRTALASTFGLIIIWRATACGGAPVTAHEWGTFTSVQGADGVQLEWNPFIRTDLPSFVYDRVRSQGTGWQLYDAGTKDSMLAIVRMETPVIYFYSALPATVDVRVDFPQGRITEWYPQASQLGPYATTDAAEKAKARSSFIEWKGVKILSPSSAEITADKLIREKGANHYYSARETAANLLRVEAPRGARSKTEYDRVLFYRGTGLFRAPLKVTAGTSTERREAASIDDVDLHISTASAVPMTDLFVLNIRAGQARYQYFDKIGAADERTVNLSTAPFGSLDSVRIRLMDEMKQSLVRQGLYAPEAQAMVNTWKDQWFAEEGTRVLYLLPRAWTDHTLPLDIKPAPAEMVRIMVGRAEVITPGVERALSRSIATFNQGGTARQQALMEAHTLGLGRFVQPAVRRVVMGKSDRTFVDAAWKLATELSRIETKNSVVDLAPAPTPVTPAKTAAVPTRDVSHTLAAAASSGY